MWLIYHCHFFHIWECLVWTFLFSGADSFSRMAACIIQAQCSILTELHLISGPGLDSSVVYEVEHICTDHILISYTKQRRQQGYRKYVCNLCWILVCNGSSISVSAAYFFFFFTAKNLYNLSYLCPKAMFQYLGL